ncbi:MAG: hypothetical protein EBS18_06795, partial [Actinobacteria bacterium]|nr:hypothetical protein [Actinomycetota bacterium]
MLSTQEEVYLLSASLPAFNANQSLPLLILFEFDMLFIWMIWFAIQWQVFGIYSQSKWWIWSVNDAYAIQSTAPPI